MAATDKHLEDLSAITAQTMQKTREAIDIYFNLMQRSISAYPWGGTELGEKLKSVAEENVAAFMNMHGR